MLASFGGFSVRQQHYSLFVGAASGSAVAAVVSFATAPIVPDTIEAECCRAIFRPPSLTSVTNVDACSLNLSVACVICGSYCCRDESEKPHRHTHESSEPVYRQADTETHPEQHEKQACLYM